MGLQYTFIEGARWRWGAVHKSKIEAALASGDPSGSSTHCAKSDLEDFHQGNLPTSDISLVMALYRF